jgi:hypothetical protein
LAFIAYYLGMLTATQFKDVLDRAKQPNVRLADLQDVFDSLGKKSGTGENLVRLDMFISDVEDYANRPNVEVTPLKGLKNEEWFNLVKLLNSRFLKTNKNIINKFTPDQKRALNITGSLERYPTVARILNA